MKEAKETALYPSAALVTPSRAFTYRFFLSSCFLLLILFSLTLGHSSVGVFIFSLMNIIFCADILLTCAGKDLFRVRLTFTVAAVFCILSGFLFSLFNTFLSRPLAAPTPDLYLYTSFLITMVLWLLRRMTTEREKTRVFIKKLDDFLPKSGRLCTGRTFRKVFANELKKGDLIFVKVGERFPCDGVLRKGKTSIDEQLITGNMLPTAKKEGSCVYAGTLNKSDGVYVEVTKVLEESALMEVITSIKNAELNRGAGKNILDKFSVWFLVSWILCAVGIYFFTIYTKGTFSNWGSVLWLLGVAFPIPLVFCVVFPSFFARNGARARKIKIQNIYALQRLEQAETFFLDKTGTLTYGELRISGVYAASEKIKKEMLRCVASAEQLVDGPFADAVNVYAKEHKIHIRKVKCFDVFPGLGVEAQVGDDKILAGRLQWLKEKGISAKAQEEGISAKTEAVICVAKNGKFLGYLTLADQLRPAAKEMVEFLKNKEKEVVLLSGDNEASVSVMAAEAGIIKYNANMLPKMKAEIVSNLRSLGKRVVMVGDGFNDIIALLRADAGIVFSSGRNVYNNWVDIIIKRKDLRPILYLFKINKKLKAVSLYNILLLTVLQLALAVWVLGSGRAVSWQYPAMVTLAEIILIWLNSVRLLKIK